MPSVTQEKIARRAGVSQQAVAFALSSRLELQGKLRPETRQRIMETALHMGYVPHMGAKRMARMRSGNRSMTLDQIGLVYFARTDLDQDLGSLELMSGIEHELSRSHSSLVFVRVGHSDDWSKIERLARSGGLDGWLLYGPVDDDAIDRIRRIKLPFAVLGDHRCTQSVASVNIDYSAAGQLAVRHLSAMGHRRIGYLGASMRFAYQRNTLAGFRAATAELGLTTDDRLIQSSERDLSLEYHDLVARLLALKPLPTAVFAAEPDSAHAVLAAFHHRGIDMPRDMQLITNRIRDVRISETDVTNIDLSFENMGREGVLLLRRVASEPSMSFAPVMIAPSLSGSERRRVPGVREPAI